ncbi:MAG TPA: hypothetical protein VN541_18695 [Tepidisphaeraceae bacterium]|nr:hypothetical protein [Tepidisphaeraceae bacterium]
MKLDYAMPGRKQPPRPRGPLWSSIAGCLIGVLVTPVAFLLAIISAGAGHGHYVAARLLFPLEMLSTVDAITNAQIRAALLQFPFYGLIFGFCLSIRGVFGYTVMAAVIIIHVAAVIACFSGTLSGFW